MYLVSGWCKNNFGASLQALKPDITHYFLQKCFGIKHTASAVFAAFWLVLLFREWTNFIRFS